MGFLAAARRNHFLNERRIEERGGGRPWEPTNGRPKWKRKGGMHIWLKILPLLGEKGEKVGFRIDGDVCEEQIGSGRKKGKEGAVVE